MVKALNEDVLLFSALKTHAQLFEASRLLRKDDGTIKSFNEFANDFNKINPKYNQQYLEAEHQFGLSSIQSVGNWANLQDDTTRYNLQYRTAQDERVRASHQKLNLITLPKDDPFWSLYNPPNGWRCRCVSVEVRAAKYEKSDSDAAIQKGETATTQISASGKNALSIFRFNPGKDKVIFPPKHPYNLVAGANKVKASIAKIAPKQKEINTLKQVNVIFEEFAGDNPSYFARGFNFIKKTQKRGVNGYTNMSGEIYLSGQVADNVIGAMNVINKGEKTTLEHETALSTLHHKIWHNANKPGYVTMSNIQRQQMELANEFVSRKTLPDFMEKLGGKLNNDSLITDRTNTAYNTMVRNYDKLIEVSKSDKAKVLGTVKDHLVNGKYTDQLTGLTKAIEKNNAFGIDAGTIKELITRGIFDSEEGYADYLKKKNDLFKTKSK